MGNCSIRVLGAIGSVISLSLGVYALVEEIDQEPWQLLLHAYVVIFGLLGLLVETISCNCCRSIFLTWRLALEFWAKFLTRAWGKGFMYGLLAGMIMAKWTFWWFSAGVYLFVVSFCI
eukprot:UN27535